MINSLNIILSNKNSKIPKKGTQYSAGYDLYSCESGVIEPLTHKCINLGIKMNIPEGYYGKIEPRSGLAYRNCIHTMAGIIDSDYRGEIKVILYNGNKDSTFEYSIHDRIAQMIFIKYEDFNFNEIGEFEVNSNRGESGFGSTGV